MRETCSKKLNDFFNHHLAQSFLVPQEIANRDTPPSRTEAGIILLGEMFFITGLGLAIYGAHNDNKGNQAVAIIAAIFLGIYLLARHGQSIGKAAHAFSANDFIAHTVGKLFNRRTSDASDGYQDASTLERGRNDGNPFAELNQS